MSNKTVNQSYFLICVPFASKEFARKKIVDLREEIDGASMTLFDYDPRKLPPMEDGADFELEERGKPPKFSFFGQLNPGQAFRFGNEIFMRGNDDVTALRMGDGNKRTFNEKTPVIPVRAKLVIEDFQED